VRFCDDTPQLLARARATVAAWREQYPQGTYDALIDDLGPGFPRDYEPVLRSVLSALERHGANVLYGVAGVAGGGQ